MQNICSELRSHTGDCLTAVTLSAGSIVPNSVISAAHFAVQSSAPAPGSPPETPKCVPLAVRADQQSTGSSNLGERRAAYPPEAAGLPPARAWRGGGGV